MNQMPEPSANSVWMRRISWIASAIPVFFLAMSGVMKLRGGPELEQGFAHLGLPASLALPLGILDFILVALYLFPLTSVLGAILLTGYMGGAMVSHLRVGDPYFIQFLLGVSAWLGIYLRDARLRALLPLRKP